MTRRVVSVGLLAAIVVCDGAAGESARASRWWSHLAVLADDAMEGRDTGSPGERRAAAYVASQFRSDGLHPAGTAAYFQPVSLSARRVSAAVSVIELVRGEAVERQVSGEDLVINAAVDPAERLDAPLVFGGYGLRIPELQYDDLRGLDVRGAVVVLLAGGPSSIPPRLKSHYQSNPEFSRGLVAAGAIGVVTIAAPQVWTRVSRVAYREAMHLAEPRLGVNEGLRLALTVNPARADRWLSGSGHTFAELFALAQAGGRLPRFRLTSSLRARVRVEARALRSQNVIAVWPGKEALKDEFVIVSAHLDHLGMGEPMNGDRIYNGALDNAAGVATLLDLAHRLSRMADHRARRSVLFLVVTGEEEGLLGSRFFSARPTVDLAQVVAVVNCDMFLPIHAMRMVTAFGMNESDIGDVVRRVARASNLAAQDDPVPERNAFVRSDHYSFVRLGIPAVMVGIGAEPGSADERLQHAWLSDRYHSRFDDLQQPIDLHAASDYNEFVLALVTALAHEPAPHWKASSFFRRFEGTAR